MLLLIARSENDLEDFIAGHQIDWDYLLDLANNQGMIPLLYLGLKEIKQVQIPTRITDYLEVSYFKNTQRNLLLVSRLVKLLRLLDKNGIEVVPFKGVLLSKDIYDSYTMRHAGDIDILVKPKSKRLKSTLA